MKSLLSKVVRRSKVLRRFVGEEEGQSMVEYGLLISLMALVIVIAVTIFGKGVKGNLYDNTQANLQNLPTSG